MMKLLTVNAIINYYCLIIVNYITVNVIAKGDYCDPTLCAKNLKHIGCGNDGEPASKCSGQFIDLSHVKEEILKEHNKIRNEVALGKIENLKPAVRMATMAWNDELAYLAELNVKKCEFKHDECRNTKTFRFSGQNLGYMATLKLPDIVIVVQNLIKSWKNEHEHANMDVINKYRIGKTNSKIVGHFTEMINDRNTHIGCALLQKDSGIFHFALFVCNYATNNIVGHKIYESGPTASKCTKGKNPKYEGLCDPSEPINPNQII